MSFLKNIWRAISGYFTSGRAQRDAERALQIAREAAPIIAAVADIAVKITPTTLDDAAWAAAKSAVPRLFDGSITRDSEMKLYLGQLATELLRRKYPNESTRVLNLAREIAYINWHALHDGDAIA